MTDLPTVETVQALADLMVKFDLSTLTYGALTMSRTPPPPKQEPEPKRDEFTPFDHFKASSPETQDALLHRAFSSQGR